MAHGGNMNKQEFLQRYKTEFEMKTPDKHNIKYQDRDIFNAKNDRDKMSSLIRTKCHTPNRVGKSYEKNLKEIY